MIFYNEYFDLGPKCFFALRFNRYKDGEMISPFVSRHVGDKKPVIWDKYAKAVEDAKGIFCTSFKQFNKTNVYQYGFELSFYSTIALLLLEYTPECIIQKNPYGESKELQEMFRETVLRKTNLLNTDAQFFTVPYIVYMRCIEKQKYYLGCSYEYINKEYDDFCPILGKIISLLYKCKCGKLKIHGIDHFERVEYYGKLLQTKDTDANVIRAFAYLHDCFRESDGHDLEHGPRAADFIENWRYTFLSYLDDNQFGKLQDAIRWHTSKRFTYDPTINACFDADRLDLWRCGITLNPEKMASEKGWLYAKYGLQENEKSSFSLRLGSKVVKLQEWHNSIIDEHLDKKYLSFK